MGGERFAVGEKKQRGKDDSVSGQQNPNKPKKVAKRSGGRPVRNKQKAMLKKKKGEQKGIEQDSDGKQLGTHLGAICCSGQLGGGEAVMLGEKKQTEEGNKHEKRSLVLR